MNINAKFFLIILVGLFLFLYFLTYELLAQVVVVKKYIENLAKSQSEIESPFIPIPIELPQNEVVILQPKEIELPKAKEIALPKPNNIIKGATSAFISNFSGGIR